MRQQPSKKNPTLRLGPEIRSLTGAVDVGDHSIIDRVGRRQVADI
jgi:hypothetical protein